MSAEPSIPSVWAREAARRDPQGLSRDRIVAAARRLLDDEGLDALSMRSLGKRLDAGATSLYRHVANKDELIELVVDEVYAEVEVPDPAGRDEWRDGVTAAARSLRAMVLRHPWVAGVLGQVGLAYLGPNLSRASERMLGLLTAAGFEPGEADLAINTVMAYVIGTVTSETAWLSLVARSGKTEQELIEGLQEVREHLTQTPAAREHNDAARYRDDSFTFGLEVVLDGLDTRLRRKA
ncbi:MULTISPECIES: TetR/AcrR family transcriptional regulator [Glycomyces]|uniref:AcrR family transcriptional regulator n=2 Tax=Glycomyces TaxID=58113 RepID=A0A9X3PJS7_9ACTN|nr:TetR/AcrR family transcriptional regulator [Glycomyces lechevalierae]MDA1384187.1 TetR/AcrR family transcriptional regulator [Glycomyces lechevalierae]MDR7339383.1 AcrR family transcriptional regulator [Glycomyces lechevalierae]